MHELHGEEQTAAKCGEVDEVEKEFRLGEHVEILAVARLAEVIDANGVDPGETISKPVNGKGAAFVKKEGVQVLGELLLDECPVAGREDRFGDEIRVSIDKGRCG